MEIPKYLDLKPIPNSDSHLGFCPFETDGLRRETLVAEVKKDSYQCISCGEKGKLSELINDYFKRKNIRLS